MRLCSAKMRFVGARARPRPRQFVLVLILNLPDLDQLKALDQLGCCCCWCYVLFIALIFRACTSIMIIVRRLHDERGCYYNCSNISIIVSIIVIISCDHCIRTTIIITIIIIVRVRRNRRDNRFQGTSCSSTLRWGTRGSCYLATSSRNLRNGTRTVDR